MQEMIKLLIGIVILVLAYPLGNWLAKSTKEELKSGRKWFKFIVLFSLIGVVLSLVFGNDVLLFTFSFIAIVTSRSLRN